MRALPLFEEEDFSVIPDNSDPACGITAFTQTD